MKSVWIPQRQRSRIVVILMLVLIAALLLPQFAWAAQNPATAPGTCSGAGYAGHEEACNHYFALIERYKAGELNFCCPGR
jgi:hypothetical protein